MKLGKAVIGPAIVLLLAGVVAGTCFVMCQDRIAFTVSNESGLPMKNVVVMVAATPYALGDIQAGGRGHAVVYRLPDCSPRLKYTTGENVYDLDLDTYLCSGMRGTMCISTKQGELSVTEDIGGHYVRTIPAKPGSEKGG